MKISRVDARRAAVRAQWLCAPRPTDLVTLVSRLTLIQIDPTAAVAPSIDLIPWTRLGSTYQPVHLRVALEREFTLFELRGRVLPMSDLPLYLAEMHAWPAGDQGWDRAREWLAVNEPFRRDILDRLADSGPLLSRELPDTSVVPWESSGWTNNRNVTQMLEFLARRGEIAIAGRRGAQRVWDLAERVYPDVTAVPLAEARRVRAARRLAALGIMRVGTADPAGDPTDPDDAGEPVTVDGVPGTWRLDPAALDGAFRGRTVLLSPYDRLVYDRVRLRELFDFEYLLEMYKPRNARRWGYYALPILHHDRLVGKVDATADRRAGVLRVDAVHEDVPFTAAISAAVKRELADLAGWLGLSLLLVTDSDR